MIEYFNTPIKWYEGQKDERFNEVTYGPGVSINARLDWGLKEIIDQKGNRAVSVATITTDQKIGIDDKVEFENRLWKVKSYSDINDFDNKFLFREVFL